MCIRDRTNGDLKVAHCSDTACSSATRTTVDEVGNVGQHSSMTRGTDGLALISYYDVTNGELKVAHCSNTACTAATLTHLDGAAHNIGASSSMMRGADDRGFISYYDVTNGDLKVAHCSNLACTATTLTTVDSAGRVGQYSSVANGTDGLALRYVFNLRQPARSRPDRPRAPSDGRQSQH